MEDRVEELERQVLALRASLTAQAAATAMLCSLLVENRAVDGATSVGHQHGRPQVLTPQEVALVIMAGDDAKQHEGLTPQQVWQWALQQVKAR